MPEDAGAPPEEFGDVLDSPGRDAHEAHLDDGLLDRSLAPAIALDNGRLEGRAAQLRNVELDLCVSSRGFEQKEHRKLSSLSIGSAHAF